MKSYSYQRKYQRSYEPRSVRKREQRTQRNLIRNVILTIIILVAIFAWGLPTLIGSLAVFNRFRPASSPSPSGLENATLAPPVLNIPYEATNSAQIRISGYATSSTEVNIYINDNLATTVTSGDDGSFETDPVTLNSGSNNIYGKSEDSQNRQSLASQTIILAYSNDKPNLNVNSPNDNTQIHGGDQKVTVSGTTDPDDSLSINGQTVILNSDGSFSTVVNLNNGDNEITIVAKNGVGNSTQIQRKVTYSSS